MQSIGVALEIPNYGEMTFGPTVIQTWIRIAVTTLIALPRLTSISRSIAFNHDAVGEVNPYWRNQFAADENDNGAVRAVVSSHAYTRIDAMLGNDRPLLNFLSVFN